jgi:hypothetical protein
MDRKTFFFLYLVIISILLFGYEKIVTIPIKNSNKPPKRDYPAAKLKLYLSYRKSSNYF